MNQEKGRDSIKIEVLKEGIIIQVLEFHKSKISFGRLEENDLILEHPSSSRTHAVLQVLDNGYFLMDLGSAHGTFLNKVKIPAKENVQVYAGDFVVFGQSTRKYILQVKDKKDEPKDSIKKTTQKLQSIKKLQQEEINEVTLMGRLIPAHVWKKDPKGVLCNWFEQQGYEMNIEVIDEEESPEIIGKLRMPLEIVNMVVEVKVQAQKRKELEMYICLEGCKRLHERGLLVDTEAQMTEKEKRKMRNQMFGDSDNDDDLIYDKTIKKKKTRENKAETFDSLTEKRLLLVKELEEITTILTQQETQSKKADEEDSLDAFMSNIESKNMEKTKLALEKRLPGLKQELDKVEKLLEIVRPSALVSSSINQVQPVKESIKSSSDFKIPMPTMKSPQKATEVNQPDTFDKSGKSSQLVENDQEEDGKQGRQYGAMTMDESDKHYSVETEDVEEAPDLDYRDRREIMDQNAAYGY